MALKPDEILSDREATAKAEADALEVKIDRWLKSTYEFGTYESFDDLGNVSRRAIQAVISRYHAAGWEVTYHDDQREGEWLRFKARGGK